MSTWKAVDHASGVSVTEMLDTLETMMSKRFLSSTISLIHLSTCAGLETSTAAPHNLAETGEARAEMVDMTSSSVREQR
jgi:hypothetical protein